ncbi:hypothetical protein [Solimonas sp. SE-A11]|uniref:hypothetical protein n=1 Tax=Solimonas sp. SE-A11 TaxID=3054954 RepID=UPI00259D07D4|nr:hypothetical protein [Solimonas sp. SE-A11]MDM4772700.1 hypothetical protein [Solimonas sp. SE-A11]
MSKKVALPDEIAKALAMREAGYTVLSISQKLGISVRSLQRHFAEHGARKGVLKQELLEAARTDLLNRVTSDEAIREEAARLINDDLAHARHLRALLIEATDQLKAKSLQDAVLVMRAGAAYSTAIKNTSDMLRQSLQVQRVLDRGDDAGLPELVISELTREEIEALQSSHDPDGSPDAAPEDEAEDGAILAA